MSLTAIKKAYKYKQPHRKGDVVLKRTSFLKGDFAEKLIIALAAACKIKYFKLSDYLL